MHVDSSAIVPNRSTHCLEGIWRTKARRQRAAKKREKGSNFRDLNDRSTVLSRGSVGKGARLRPVDEMLRESRGLVDDGGWRNEVHLHGFWFLVRFRSASSQASEHRNDLSFSRRLSSKDEIPGTMTVRAQGADCILS